MFRLGLAAKYLSFAFPAVGIVLIWGYGGILSLGQAAFFGLGSYMMAMFLKLEAAANPDSSSGTALSTFFGTEGLPDFMAWNSVEVLPWWWEPFHHAWFTIPAILINTPGTPVNALTTYDGHPIARRGEPRRARSLAYSASFIGGIISVLALIFLTPKLAAIAPYFGSRDILMAALLGLILVILTHRGQTLAAAALVGMGVFITVVGMEPVRFSDRFVFGLPWLRGGLALIPAVLGLFAISQAFILLQSSDVPRKIPKVMGSPFAGLFEVFRRLKRVALCSSGFGIIMGIIPGVGAFLAQFFSYGLAQTLSTTPENFATGSSEGLVAAESANNAVPAAAMIPLLALGIPGEALTAMMLSVFRVHNLIPGPKLFETQSEFVVGLYVCLFLINFVVLAFLLTATPLLIRVIKVPERFLGVVVLTLDLVRVYSLRHSLPACSVATGFGLSHYVHTRAT